MSKTKLKVNCTSCSKKDGRKLGLFCCNCGLYYHKTCVNLDSTSYQFLIESNEYICLPCKFKDNTSIIKPVVISRDCNSCLKFHKSKVIIKCKNCKLSFHRACVSNLRHTKAEISKSLWCCMHCTFPFSVLDDSDFADTFHFNSNSFLIKDSCISPPVNNLKLLKGLKLGHLNINGLYDKLDQLELFLLEYQFDVLFISETHLNIDQPYPNLHIPGYNFLRQDRERFWGGLGCFFKDTLSITQVESAFFCNENEVLSIVLNPPHSKQILLSCIYRKPSSPHNTFFLVSTHT